MNKCERCKKTIRKNDWYFIVREINKQKVISNKYVHRNCQKEYDSYIKENLISPEQKEKMAKAIVTGFKMVKQIQERAGMEA
jgi:protein-arginine kinase activator protein McsA